MNPIQILEAVISGLVLFLLTYGIKSMFALRQGQENLANQNNVFNIKLDSMKDQLAAEMMDNKQVHGEIQASIKEHLRAHVRYTDIQDIKESLRELRADAHKDVSRRSDSREDRDRE